MAISRRNLYPFLLVSILVGYLWIGINLFRTSQKGFSTCIFKNITNLPCPSCGSTRSIIAFLNGEFAESLYWNPIGILLILLLIIVPLWLCVDILYKKDSLFRFYLNVELVLEKPKYAAVGITLIIVNWIWNIYKGL
ncbi:MAG: DUF2752 domain-containing protein [Bacteroidales bacterium]|nr:DUF2752 domain-containing protein [Bacteroidales bacterium]